MDRARAIAKLTAPGRKYELQNVCVNGNEVKWFVNAPTSLRQLISEARCEKTFFVYNDEGYTFEEFYQRASNLGRRLIDDYGVKPGDRVAIGLRNYPEWALAFAAITSIGGIVAGLNAWWESDELEYGIRHIGAKMAIVDQERLDRVKLQSGLDFLTLISVRSEPCDRATPIHQLLRQHGELPDIQIEPDDDAVILFTSGSTGHPKGSVSTHRNIIAALLSWELDLAVLATIHCGAPKGQSKPHYPDAALLGMPLFHVNGLLAVLLTSFRRKRKTVAMYKWDPNVAVEFVEAEKIVSFVGTPAMTGDLMLAAQKQPPRRWSWRRRPSKRPRFPAGAVAGSSPVADSAKPVTEPLYKAGDQYGPVAANERLWDIAAKVRPGPSIGKDVMMSALFRANPQAFSKTGIDRMKVGAMLRIPTLREIADYTGSGFAKQLLEQRAKLDIPSLPKRSGSSDSVPASQSNPISVADPGASSEPSPEGGPKPASESAQPVAETHAPSVAPPAN